MRETQVVLYDMNGLTDCLRRFFGGHPAEVPHLDGPRGGRMLAGERIDRRVEIEDRNAARLEPTLGPPHS